MLFMTLTLEDLYPDATPQELEEADHRLNAYLRLVLRIQERLDRGPVDESARGVYLEDRSNDYQT